MNSTWFTALMLPLVATVTVVVADAVAPPEAVAVALYVVVCVGETDRVPPLLAIGVLVLSTLLVSTTWLAFCAVTVSTEFWPEEIEAGLAVIVTVGAGAVVVTVTVAVALAVAPVEEVAVAL
jgi:hypothetical protein